MAANNVAKVNLDIKLAVCILGFNPRDGIFLRINSSNLLNEVA